MARFFHPLILLLSRASHRQLLAHIEFLKAENEMLRSRLPRRIWTTAAERAKLVKLGRSIGPSIKHLVTIVAPETFACWMREAKGSTSRARENRTGRPSTPEEIRELILRLANENGWGYTRILGELKKLGVGGVCRSTVVNILKAAGLDPGPQRGQGSWAELIAAHAQTLWACDFISKKIWTKAGLVDYFFLFFIHVETRRVFVSPVTASPGAAWVTQQARNFFMWAREQKLEVTHLIRDNDGKFRCAFDEVFRSEGAIVCPIVPLSPNMNAYAERWVQTIKSECLDHFVVLGEQHLNHIVFEFTDYYNTVRPHQGKGNVPLSSQAVVEQGKIVCEHRLGGVLKHYYRKAA